VRSVAIAKPSVRRVLGREVYDYSEAGRSAAPRLVPLEVVFRFSVPEGSSLLERVRAQPDYLASIGFPGAVAVRGARWDFPVLELFTKLEGSDRALTLQEGALIAGIPCARLEEMLFRTAWVAGFLRDRAERVGAELADGKLEWAVDERGELLLVDAIGPDELRLLCDGVQLSKEFLREFYRRTPWYAAVRSAKEQAARAGSADWKKGLAAPPALAPALRELAAQLYATLTAEFLGEKNQVTIPALVEKIRAYADRA
jgi:phosphoribosylaminoimidazole-succinocarboxamide synthase